MTEDQIVRLTAMRDRAREDVELFEQFNVSVDIAYGDDGSRMLGHLRGTVESYDKLLLRAREQHTKVSAA